MKLFRAVLMIALLAFGVSLQSQQNPHLKVNINDYSLGLGSGSYTCYDGVARTGNQCLANWLAGSVYVINDATTGFDCTTAYPGSWCVFYFSSEPYLSNLYWIRDAVGASKYESAILHYTQDSGGLHASSIIGMDQFDWFEQTNAFTEGFNYYHPNQATNGVLLYNGAIFQSDITGLSYGAAITTVSYSGGTFTLTGIAAENFTNISAGNSITLTGFTSATFLNGKTVTVISSTGTTTPLLTFNLICSATCAGSNETGYIAVPQQIPLGWTMYIASMEPFDKINVRLAAPANGGSVTYEYSKGAGVWGDLTTAPHWNDGTAGLTSGLASTQISFYPPTDWAPDVVHGTRAKFWVRIKPTGDFLAPSIFNLRGDTLLSAYNNTSQCGTVVQAQTGHSCLLRGWSQSAWAASTACGGGPCTVAGSYKYNPSPPTSASARFIYQARLGMYGGYPNETWLDPGTLDTDGKTLAGKILSYLWTASKAAYGVQANGTMFDNAAGQDPMFNWNAGNNTDLPCSPSCVDTSAVSNFENYWLTAFTETATSLRASYPPFFVTGNLAVTHPTTAELALAPFSTAGTMAHVGPAFDLAWVEQSGNTTAPGYFNTYGQTAENQYNAASTFQISNAISDHTYQYGFCDIISATVPCLPTVWNRGIQGSMAALGQQYMFGNSNGNTALIYTLTSEASYQAGDQYYYFQDATTLTAGISSGLHALPFAFQVASTSPLSAMSNNMGGLGSCVTPGCGTDNLFATHKIVRICPALPGTCENGDIFDVSTSAPITVNPISNVTQNSVNYVGIANSYTGTEKVQIMKYGHAALTPLASMPSWQNMGVYATLAPAYRVDIGVPDSTNGWQPPNGNCFYSVNHNSYPPPSTPCSKGDPDLFYGDSGTYAFVHSAQRWSGLGCNSPVGQYHSTHGYGGAPMDCSPLSLRSYTNGLVLMRPFRTGGTLPTAPEELITPSVPIDLSSMNPTCAPTCTYQRVRPDGSLDAAISTIALKGAEVAILKGPVSGGGSLSITGPSSCPNGYQTSVYVGCFPAATGGASPYTWDLSAGALCSGLSQDGTTGAITGTPVAHQSCDFTVRVTDSASHTATQRYQPTIFWPVLTITTTSCPDGAVGVPYAGCALAYTGGNMSNTWSRIPPGLLPPGLALNASTGVISGTPTGVPGAFFFTVRVADTETPPQSAYQPLRINVGAIYPLTGLSGSASLTGSASLH